jgi:hypothetical protein
MSEQQPRVWQQCKAISEALGPTPVDAEQAMHGVGAALLAQLAAGGAKGAKLAARLAHANSY